MIKSKGIKLSRIKLSILKLLRKKLSIFLNISNSVFDFFWLTTLLPQLWDKKMIVRKKATRKIFILVVTEAKIYKSQI